MIFSKELEKLAEKRATAVCEHNGLSLDGISFEEHVDSFKFGAAALENLILKSGENFNKEDEGAFRYYADCSSQDLMDSRDAYDAGRYYQFFYDKLIIGALKKSEAFWMKQADELFEYQKQLEAKFAELNKNCISLDLYESRMKEITEKYEALKNVVDELHYVRGLE